MLWDNENSCTFAVRNLRVKQSRTESNKYKQIKT